MARQNGDDCGSAQHGVASVITPGVAGDIAGGVAQVVTRDRSDSFEALRRNAKAHFAIIAGAAWPLATLSETPNTFWRNAQGYSSLVIREPFGVRHVAGNVPRGA